MAAFVAHALRKLEELDDGWTWACRAVELDHSNLFAVVRKSLLGVLTNHNAEVFAHAKLHLDRQPANADEAENLAITIVNGILAASRIGTIAEAVEVFTPLIVRLDHPNLHYNSACMYALAGDERVWPYATKALATLKTTADFDAADFDAVRADPRFAELMARDWDAEKAALKRAGVKTREELSPEDFVDEAKLVFGAANSERNVELERAIDADVDDAAGHLVYCDWLQERGNPRGTLLLASQRCDSSEQRERAHARVSRVGRRCREPRGRVARRVRARDRAQQLDALAARVRGGARVRYRLGRAQGREPAGAVARDARVAGGSFPALARRARHRGPAPSSTTRRSST